MIRAYVYIFLRWAIAGAGVCLLICLAYTRRKRHSLKMVAGAAKWTAFAAYTAGALAVLLRLREWKIGGGGYNLIPFRSIRAELTGNLPPHEGAEAIRLGMEIIWFNLLIFVPLGIFLPVLFQKGRKWYIVLSVSLGAAVLVEAIQYFIGRTADVDDVLLRVAGCMLAYGVCCAIRSIRKRMPVDGWSVVAPVAQ